MTMKELATLAITTATSALAAPRFTSMLSSAEVGLNDARALFARDDFESAVRRSLHSLEYSTGRGSDREQAIRARALDAGVWGVRA